MNWHERTTRTLLARLAEQDPETYVHCRRVAAIAGVLSRAMGLTDPDERVWLRHGALLHDVGKLAIPTAILRKKGRLTSAEYEIVKTHAALGGEMVAALLGDPAIIAIIRHHHECFDGTGYPDGKPGDEICLGARICALADAFDVIRSGRIYCRRRSLACALAEMERCSGTRYDPAVVAAFMRCAERLDRQLYVLAVSRRRRH